MVLWNEKREEDIREGSSSKNDKPKMEHCSLAFDVHIMAASVLVHITKYLRTE